MIILDNSVTRRNEPEIDRQVNGGDTINFAGEQSHFNHVTFCLSESYEETAICISPKVRRFPVCQIA